MAAAGMKWLRALGLLAAVLWIAVRVERLRQQRERLRVEERQRIRDVERARAAGASAAAKARLLADLDAASTRVAAATLAVHEAEARRHALQERRAALLTPDDLDRRADGAGL